METLLAVFVGIGLSASCGFRVFVPLLGVSVASWTGHLELAAGFEWIGSPIALAAFGIATILEVGTYYIPWLDNLMDVIATPAAAVAGTIVTASVVTDTSPFLQWALAIIGGGGAAVIVQAGTVVVRGTSSATTGGALNPVCATAELGGAVGGTLLALFVPVVAAVLALGLCIWIGRKMLRRLADKKDSEDPAS